MYLLANERNNAFTVILRTVQFTYFKEDVVALKGGKPISKTSCLKALDPWLDENDILRVGGRLKKSMFGINVKHPIILYTKSNFAMMYVKYVHEKFFHANKLLLKNHVKLQFWPVGGLDRIVKSVVHKNVLCAFVLGLAVLSKRWDSCLLLE